MRRPLALGGVLVFAATAVAAEETAVALTFEQALRRAVDKNLTVARAREEVVAAKATKRAIFSIVLPKITASGSLTRNSEEVAFGSGADARTILPENDWTTRITVQQPIFAGLRDLRAYSQARVGVEGAQDLVAAAEDAALLRVAADYLAAVQGMGLIDVEQQSLELARDRRRHAQNLLEAGETTRVEVLRAETAIKAAERRVIAARQMRNAAIGRLRVGLLLEGDVQVQEPSAPLTPPPDEATLLDRAERERPEARQAAHQLRFAELEVQKEWGAYLPIVTAEAGYVRQKVEFPKDRFGYAALRFTVPLFQGSDVSGRVAAARARRRQAEMALDEARRAVREDVHIAVLDLEAARTSAKLAEEQLAAAEEEHQQTLERYRSQEATALDMEAAETSLADARRAVVSGRLEQRLAELRAWATGGSLKTAVLEGVR